MKFQAVFILLIHIDWILGKSASSGKLSLKENEHRLKTCGTETIPTPSKNASLIPVNKTISWIWMSHSSFPKISISSIAYRISSKHLITFSNTILNKKMEWIHNASRFESNCTNNGLHLEVPEDVVKQLKITPLECSETKTKDCQDKTLTPSRGYLVKMCDNYVKMNFFHGYSIMIIEVDNVPGEETACLLGSSTRLNVGDLVNSYQFDPKLHHSVVNVTVKYETSFGTTESIPKKGYQNLLVNIYDRRSTIMGITETKSGFKKNLNMRFYYNLQYFEDDICSIIGVCPGGATKITKTSTTPTLTATKEIITVPPTTTTVAVTTPSTIQKPETTTSESTTTPETTTTIVLTTSSEAITTTAVTTSAPKTTTTSESSTTPEATTSTLMTTTTSKVFKTSTESSTPSETSSTSRTSSEATMITSPETSNTKTTSGVRKTSNTDSESSTSSTTTSSSQTEESVKPPIPQTTYKPPKPIQKTSTSKKPEEDYDYEEYEENGEEKPKSSALETDESLYDDVENGGGEVKKILELTFLIFVILLLR